MANPQQPELRRSGKTPLDPDSIASEVEARELHPETSEPRGPVPPDNRPGHHPEREQDKPDPDAFAAKARGDTRQPSREAAEAVEHAGKGRGPLVKVGLTAAGAVGTAVGVRRALRRRR